MANEMTRRWNRPADQVFTYYHGKLTRIEVAPVCWKCAGLAPRPKRRSAP